MATLDIAINPATFSAGGALAVAYWAGDTSQAYPLALRGKTILPINSGSFLGNDGGFPVAFSTATLNSATPVKGAIQIGAGASTFVDSAQLGRMGQWFKNTLADLVNKGIIIVNIGGVAQTASQIINLS